MTNVCSNKMTLIGTVSENHVVLLDWEPDVTFIDEKKFEYIASNIPKIPLKRLSKDDFKDSIMKLAGLVVEKLKQEVYGKIFYVAQKRYNVRVPAVYDFLCEMFFHIETYDDFYELTESFYHKRILSDYGVNKEQFRAQVRLFLPYAKVEVLYHQLCKEEEKLPATLHHRRRSKDQRLADIEKAALDVEEYFMFPELYREECYLILENIYRSAEAKLIGFDIVKANGLPGNLGKYFKIRLTAKHDKQIQTHNLFAKMIDKDDELISAFAILPFKKERYFFETMLECFKEFGMEDLTDFCPKCCFARNDMIVFEDISIDGYSSWNYHVSVSYKWLVTTIKLLAKLHGASIVLEEKLSKKFGRIVRLDEEFSELTCEVAFIENVEYKPFRDCYKRSVYEYLLSKFPEVSRVIQMDNLKEKVKTACDSMYEVVKQSEKIRNVLNHGDMWGANIMYKEDQDTGTPSAYLIDFQITRYCPPSLDLMFLLYTNTDRATRLEHMEDLMQLYYKELTGILSSYDINIGDIFTFGQLLVSCKDVEPAMICTAIMYGEVMLMPEDFRKEMRSDKERERHFNVVDKVPELEKLWEYEPFKVRIKGLIEDLIQIYDDEV